MPYSTTRHGKVRKLLKSGLAHVVCRIPFTIRLDYETTRFTQPVTLGIDAGSKHVGVSATTSTRDLPDNTNTLNHANDVSDTHYSDATA